MAGELTTTRIFADGEQVTSAKLNEIVSGASPTASFITGTTLSWVGGKVKVGTITLSEMGAASVGTTQLVDTSVTTGKIAAGAVTNTQLGNLAVTGDKIANNTLTISNMSGLIATQATMQAQVPGSIVTASTAIYAPGSAKCYGQFSASSSSRSLNSQSFNVQSVERLSATQTRVDIGVNMADDNYFVMANLVSDGSETGDVAVYDKTASSFKLKHPTEASGRAVAFVVFGRRS